LRLRAISFDLFDTLVDLSMETLPVFAVDGEPMRGTQEQLFAALPPSARARLDLGAFVRADAELRAARMSEGRELETLARFRELCARLKIAEPQLPERLTELHMEAIYQRASYFAHHCEVLRQLGGRLQLALCSNFSHTPTAERVLREAKLRERFDAVVISADCGVRKPRAEIFRAVTEQLQLEPGAILHVGDRLDEDIAGAHAAGMHTAWITRRVADPALALLRYSGPPPEVTLADLGELLGHIAL
jgi:HAD superfamily hydrolase (TIGR01549 family)